MFLFVFKMSIFLLHASLVCTNRNTPEITITKKFIQVLICRLLVFFSFILMLLSRSLALIKSKSIPDMACSLLENLPVHSASQLATYQLTKNKKISTETVFKC